MNGAESPRSVDLSRGASSKRALVEKKKSRRENCCRKPQTRRVKTLRVLSSRFENLARERAQFIFFGATGGAQGFVAARRERGVAFRAQRELPGAKM